MSLLRYCSSILVLLFLILFLESNNIVSAGKTPCSSTNRHFRDGNFTLTAAASYAVSDFVLCDTITIENVLLKQAATLYLLLPAIQDKSLVILRNFRTTVTTVSSNFALSVYLTGNLKNITKLVFENLVVETRDVRISFVGNLFVASNVLFSDIGEFSIRNCVVFSRNSNAVATTPVFSIMYGASGSYQRINTITYDNNSVDVDGFTHYNINTTTNTQKVWLVHWNFGAVTDVAVARFSNSEMKISNANCGSILGYGVQWYGGVTNVGMMTFTNMSVFVSVFLAQFNMVADPPWDSMGVFVDYRGAIAMFSTDTQNISLIQATNCSLSMSARMEVGYPRISSLHVILAPESALKKFLDVGSVVVENSIFYFYDTKSSRPSCACFSWSGDADPDETIVHLSHFRGTENKFFIRTFSGNPDYKTVVPSAFTVLYVATAIRNVSRGMFFERNEIVLVTANNNYDEVAIETPGTPYSLSQVQNMITLAFAFGQGVIVVSEIVVINNVITSASFCDTIKYNFPDWFVSSSSSFPCSSSQNNNIGDDVVGVSIRVTNAITISCLNFWTSIDNIGRILVQNNTITNLVVEASVVNKSLASASSPRSWHFNIYFSQSTSLVSSIGSLSSAIPTSSSSSSSSQYSSSLGFFMDGNVMSNINVSWQLSDEMQYNVQFGSSIYHFAPFRLSSCVDTAIVANNIIKNMLFTCLSPSSNPAIPSSYFDSSRPLPKTPDPATAAVTDFSKSLVQFGLVMFDEIHFVYYNIFANNTISNVTALNTAINCAILRGTDSPMNLRQVVVSGNIVENIYGGSGCQGAAVSIVYLKAPTLGPNFIDGINITLNIIRNVAVFAAELSNMSTSTTTIVGDCPISIFLATASVTFVKSFVVSQNIIENYFSAGYLMTNGANIYAAFAKLEGIDDFVATNNIIRNGVVRGPTFQGILVLSSVATIINLFISNNEINNIVVVSNAELRVDVPPSGSRREVVRITIWYEGGTLYSANSIIFSSNSIRNVVASNQGLSDFSAVAAVYVYGFYDVSRFVAFDILVENITMRLRLSAFGTLDSTYVAGIAIETSITRRSLFVRNTTNIILRNVNYTSTTATSLQNAQMFAAVSYVRISSVDANIVSSFVGPESSTPLSTSFVFAQNLLVENIVVTAAGDFTCGGFAQIGGFEFVDDLWVENVLVQNLKSTISTFTADTSRVAAVNQFASIGPIRRGITIRNLATRNISTEANNNYVSGIVVASYADTPFLVVQNVTLEDVSVFAAGRQTYGEKCVVVLLHFDSIRAYNGELSNISSVEFSEFLVRNVTLLFGTYSVNAFARIFLDYFVAGLVYGGTITFRDIWNFKLINSHVDLSTLYSSPSNYNRGVTSVASETLAIVGFCIDSWFKSAQFYRPQGSLPPDPFEPIVPIFEFRPTNILVSNIFIVAVFPSTTSTSAVTATASSFSIFSVSSDLGFSDAFWVSSLNLTIDSCLLKTVPFPKFSPTASLSSSSVISLWPTRVSLLFIADTAVFTVEYSSNYSREYFYKNNTSSSSADYINCLLQVSNNVVDVDSTDSFSMKFMGFYVRNVLGSNRENVSFIINNNNVQVSSPNVTGSMLNVPRLLYLPNHGFKIEITDNFLTSASSVNQNFSLFDSEALGGNSSSARIVVERNHWRSVGSFGVSNQGKFALSIARITFSPSSLFVVNVSVNDCHLAVDASSSSSILDSSMLQLGSVGTGPIVARNSIVSLRNSSLQIQNSPFPSSFKLSLVKSTQDLQQISLDVRSNKLEAVSHDNNVKFDESSYVNLLYRSGNDLMSNNLFFSSTSSSSSSFIFNGNSITSSFPSVTSLLLLNFSESNNFIQGDYYFNRNDVLTTSGSSSPVSHVVSLIGIFNQSLLRKSPVLLNITIQDHNYFSSLDSANNIQGRLFSVRSSSLEQFPPSFFQTTQFNLGCGHLLKNSWPQIIDREFQSSIKSLASKNSSLKIRPIHWNCPEGFSYSQSVSESALSATRDESASSSFSQTFTNSVTEPSKSRRSASVSDLTPTISKTVSLPYTEPRIFSLTAPEAAVSAETVVAALFASPVDAAYSMRMYDTILLAAGCPNNRRRNDGRSIYLFEPLPFPQSIVPGFRAFISPNNDQPGAYILGSLFTYGCLLLLLIVVSLVIGFKDSKKLRKSPRISAALKRQLGILSCAPIFQMICRFFSMTSSQWIPYVGMLMASREYSQDFKGTLIAIACVIGVCLLSVYADIVYCLIHIEFLPSKSDILKKRAEIAAKKVRKSVKKTESENLVAGKKQKQKQQRDEFVNPFEIGAKELEIASKKPEGMTSAAYQRSLDEQKPRKNFSLVHRAILEWPDQRAVRFRNSKTGKQRAKRPPPIKPLRREMREFLQSDWGRWIYVGFLSWECVSRRQLRSREILPGFGSIKRLGKAVTTLHGPRGHRGKRGIPPDEQETNGCFDSLKCRFGPFFAVGNIVITLTISFLRGIALERPEICDNIRHIIFGLNLATALMMMFVRPYLVPGKNALMIVMELLGLVIAVLCLPGVSDTVDSDGKLRETFLVIIGFSVAIPICHAGSKQVISSLAGKSRFKEDRELRGACNGSNNIATFAALLKQNKYDQETDEEEEEEEEFETDHINNHDDDEEGEEMENADEADDQVLEQFIPDEHEDREMVKRLLFASPSSSLQQASEVTAETEAPTKIVVKDENHEEGDEEEEYEEEEQRNEQDEEEYEELEEEEEEK